MGREWNSTWIWSSFNQKQGPFWDCWNHYHTLINLYLGLLLTVIKSQDLNLNFKCCRSTSMLGEWNLDTGENLCFFVLETWAHPNIPVVLLLLLLSLLLNIFFEVFVCFGNLDSWWMTFFLFLYIYICNLFSAFSSTIPEVSWIYILDLHQHWLFH